MPDKTILVVDDIESNRALVKMVLDDRYTVLEADSGKVCLEMVAKAVPAVILLDVNMPGMTGYEVCATLRKNAATNSTPIIFVSAMDNVEERLAGFEAGGDEYVTKPVDPDILMEKIEYRLAHQAEVRKAKADASEAMNVAMEAMTSSSELGQIIEFVKSSQQVSTLEGIGEQICEVVAGFGLSACTRITGSTPTFFNCDADSLEAKILAQTLGAKERIVSIGVRTIVCSDHMAILIRDMPIDDDSRYGRFKDHLVVLLSICEGRLLTIQSQLNMSGQRQDVLGRVIKMTEVQVKELGEKLKVHDDSVRQVMLNMVTELEAKLFTLGLDEDQEEQLMSLAYEATETLDKLKGGTEKMTGELGKVLEGLYEILDKNQ